jgi:hypothetical protein
MDDDFEVLQTPYIGRPAGVRRAAAHPLTRAVWAGGHNVAGRGTCHGSPVLDLRARQCWWGEARTARTLASAGGRRVAVDEDRELRLGALAFQDPVIAT